ncbi:MAG: four helix bundle protein [Longimicrobiales bacterium]|nr:four helix bundle protein [Longimicrobiales bacterium]
MGFNFEAPRVWQDAMAYNTDTAYALALQLPDLERFNLAEQLRRAATSVALNIAEGSTGETPNETRRFIAYAIRSAVECAACHRLILRRGYPVDSTLLRTANDQIELLFARMQAFRKSIPER